MGPQGSGLSTFRISFFKTDKSLAKLKKEVPELFSVCAYLCLFHL